jgi:hypothetical protein
MGNTTTLIDWTSGRNGIVLKIDYAAALLVTTNGWDWTGLPVNRAVLEKLLDELLSLRDSGRLDEVPRDNDERLCGGLDEKVW